MTALRLTLKIIICAIVILILTACTIHHTPYITKELNPAVLYESFQTEPINMAFRSKCKELPSVTIVNAETREVIPWGTALGLVEHDYNAKELMDHIVDYMADALIKCKINVTEHSRKTIKISMKELKYILGVWSQGASVELRIEIPEINYSKSYTGTGNAYGGTPRAAAYAIHTVIWDIIKDPIVLDYIVCETPREKLPERDSALDILKKRYARGEITKEQFEQMKKDIE